MAGAIREALEVAWKNEKTEKKLEKKPVPKWELVLDPVLDLKMGSLWSRNNL